MKVSWNNNLFVFQANSHFRIEVRKKVAFCGNYQTLINQALREYILQQREPLESTLRRVIREELGEYKSE